MSTSTGYNQTNQNVWAEGGVHPSKASLDFLEFKSRACSREEIGTCDFDLLFLSTFGGNRRVEACLLSSVILPLRDLRFGEVKY